MTDAGPRRPRGATRAAILRCALLLFGEKGYAATSVAEIEAAAGLRPGSGGLYRHFASKRDVLEAGVRGVLDARSGIADMLAMEPAADRDAWCAQLRAIAGAGFARLDHDRDLSRIMIRDLRDVPGLAEEVRRREVDETTAALADWLRRSVAHPAAAGAPTAEDLAAVVVAAVSHHWTLTDAMGAAPLGIDRAAFVDTLAALIASALRPAGR